MIINCIKNDATIDDIKSDNKFMVRDTKSGNVFLLECVKFSPITFFLQLLQKPSFYFRCHEDGKIIMTKEKLVKIINSNQYTINY